MFTKVVNMYQASEALDKLYHTQGLELTHYPGGTSILTQHVSSDQAQTYYLAIGDRQQLATSTGTYDHLVKGFSEIHIPLEKFVK